jgi:methyl-accepting chemotaxis protein
VRAVWFLMALNLDALETSFDLVAPRGEELVETFYTRLFTAAPAVVPLFAGTDMGKQRTKLLVTLVLLRKSLRDLDALVPTLRELGRRHVGYGARPEHYAVVGDTLIAAMAEVAGAAWRAEYTRAWADALSVVAEAMLSGTDPSPTGPAAVGVPSPAAT